MSSGQRDVVCTPLMIRIKSHLGAHFQTQVKGVERIRAMRLGGPKNLFLQQAKDMQALTQHSVLSFAIKSCSSRVAQATLVHRQAYKATSSLTMGRNDTELRPVINLDFTVLRYSRNRTKAFLAQIVLLIPPPPPRREIPSAPEPLYHLRSMIRESHFDQCPIPPRVRESYGFRQDENV